MSSNAAQFNGAQYIREASLRDGVMNELKSILGSDSTYSTSEAGEGTSGGEGMAAGGSSNADSGKGVVV